MIKPTVSVKKTTTFKLFGWPIFVREEFISTGDGVLEVEVQPEYFDSEFNIGGKDD